jgi:hypothetical protein
VLLVLYKLRYILMDGEGGKTGAVGDEKYVNEPIPLIMYNLGVK